MAGAASAAGVLLVQGEGCWWAVVAGRIALDEVQMEGKKRMSAAEFLRGFRCAAAKGWGFEQAARGEGGGGVRAEASGVGRAYGSAAEAMAKISPARRPRSRFSRWWVRARATAMRCCTRRERRLCRRKTATWRPHW